MNVLVITRTDWNEPPRMRHQLSRLLRDIGHQVSYIQITPFITDLKFSEWKKEGINFYRFSEHIHHQLRPFAIIRKAHQFIVKKKLSIIAKRNNFDLVVNFNYDLTFVKTIFPKAKIITMLNDHFYLQARPWMKNAILSQIAETCAISDKILTVSYPLVDFLKPFNQNIQLLLPWAQNSYSAPKERSCQDKVLYFGYIDDRLDYGLIHFLLQNDISIDFIGPVRKLDARIKKLQSKRNVKFLPAQNIADLNVDEYYCSIVPYDPDVKYSHCITANNRMFNLLSKGLPIVFPVIKTLLHAPDTVIRQSTTKQDFLDNINFFKTHFAGVQDDIQFFLQDHYSPIREVQIAILLHTLFRNSEEMEIAG